MGSLDGITARVLGRLGPAIGDGASTRGLAENHEGCFRDEARAAFAADDMPNVLPRVKVVLVTGASSGIGAAIAGHLAAGRARVFGTSRSPTAHFPDGVRPLAMDVTREGSVREGVELVTHSEGHLDAVVNNAGVTLLGAIEETSTEEALALFDTNVLGVHRVTRAALPHLLTGIVHQWALGQALVSEQRQKVAELLGQD